MRIAFAAINKRAMDDANIPVRGLGDKTEEIRRKIS